MTADHHGQAAGIATLLARTLGRDSRHAQVTNWRCGWRRSLSCGAMAGKRSHEPAGRDGALRPAVAAGTARGPWCCAMMPSSCGSRRPAGSATTGPRSPGWCCRSWSTGARSSLRSPRAAQDPGRPLPSHRRDLPAQAESWAALPSGSDTAENRHQKGHPSASLVPGRSACRSAGSLLSARTRGNLLPAD